MTGLLAASPLDSGEENYISVGTLDRTSLASVLKFFLSVVTLRSCTDPGVDAAGELGSSRAGLAGLAGGGPPWPPHLPLSLRLLAATCQQWALALPRAPLSLGCSSPSPVAHSGASVLAVENRYPFIFIFYYPE